MVEIAHYRPATGDLNWDGAVNARRIIGPIYRMGRREWLTSQGWEQMRLAGVRRVLDLRNPGENRVRAADPQISAQAMTGIQVLNLPLEEPGNARFEKIAVPYMNHPAMYRLVCEEFPDRLSAVFKELANAEGGVVLHCSAGRDRSGLIASLLLGLTGADEQILNHDELGTRGINEWHRVSGYRHPYESYQQPAALQAVIDSRAEALEGFMEWVGSAEDFLRRIGVDQAARTRLRTTFLVAES